jgi:Transcription factor DP
MDIITKDKKDIIWRGLPRGPGSDDDPEEEKEDSKPPPPPPEPIYTDAAEYDEHEFAAMQREREYLEAEVARKQEALREILVQQVCFRNLVMRNQRREYPRPGGPHKPPPEDEKIPLPFIISNTRPSAVVQCDMNKEKTDVMFEFDSPFEINDDNTILKRMEM